jgi:hypothetical protein
MELIDAMNELESLLKRSSPDPTRVKGILDQLDRPDLIDACSVLHVQPFDGETSDAVVDRAVFQYGILHKGHLKSAKVREERDALRVDAKVALSLSRMLFDELGIEPVPEQSLVSALWLVLETLQQNAPLLEGWEVRAWRIHARVSLREAAHRLGVRHVELGKIEAGRTPNPFLTSRLKEILGPPPEVFEKGKADLPKLFSEGKRNS